MTGEADIAGVFVHPLLIAAIVAFPLAEAAGWLLGRTAFYRIVWHRGLFDVAMTLILWALVAMAIVNAHLAPLLG